MAQRNTLPAFLLAALGTALLAGCAMQSGSRGGAGEPQTAGAEAGAGRNYVALRVSGLVAGNGSVYLVDRDRSGERSALIGRCREVSVDRLHPEGLLLPVQCDGQRITVHRRSGRLVVQRE